MKIIKRSGEEVLFDGGKIIAAIKKANLTVTEDKRLSDEDIIRIESDVEAKCNNLTRAANVEEIQDFVENALMDAGNNDVARKYITYRYQHALMRKANTTDDKIMSLIEESG